MSLQPGDAQAGRFDFGQNAVFRQNLDIHASLDEFSCPCDVCSRRRVVCVVLQQEWCAEDPQVLQSGQVDQASDAGNCGDRLVAYGRSPNGDRCGVAACKEGDR